MYEPKWISKFEVKPGSWVYVPTESAVDEGKEIKEEIELKWKAPDYYFHLRNGGHVEAIKSHLENDVFLHLDIKNFFGQINKSKVTRCLKKFLGYQRARAIAKTSTVREPGNYHTSLPFGFVQSSLIASVCLRYSKLGNVLHTFNGSEDISVSVYVDDIIVSNKCAETLTEMKVQLEDAADFSGFPFNVEKTEGPASVITAFNIILEKGNIEITKERFSDLFYDYQNVENEHVQHGIAGYVSTVNTAQLIKLVN